MNAVFCCLNSKYIHSSLAPWCLFTASKQKCNQEINLFVVEGTINENPDAIGNRILTHNPDVVLFSCYIWNISKTFVLCKNIKQHSPSTQIVVGGPEVSFNAKQILTENYCIDFVSAGAGEVAIPKLLDSIFLNQPVDIPGISLQKDGIISVDTREPATDDSISPYCEEYLQNLGGRIAYMESSRGCPFRCSFCLSGRLGKVRYMDMETVKNNILLLSNTGTKTVKFVDRTFNCNKERAAEILKFILDNYGNNIPERICFHFEIAADLLDNTLFEIIEKLPTGCVQFEVGIQSFNTETLQRINRKTDLTKVEYNVKKLMSFGNCHVHIDLIAGLPAENFESFVNGFNRAYAINANMLQLGFLKILHGTPMADDKVLYPCNHCSAPPYEVIDTPWITQEELQKLHIAENELERLYNSGRFRRTLSYVLTTSKMSPFDLFFSFGNSLNDRQNNSIPLDEYTNLAFDYFCKLDGIDKMHLRNCMIYDRIATNNSGRIPDCLKVADPDLKKVKKMLQDSIPQPKGANRSIAILYEENKIIYCDYLSKNKVTGEYQVSEYSL